LLHGHEHERGEFGALVDDLQGGPGVAAADPGVLDVGDVLAVGPQRGEEVVAVLHGLVLPVDLALVGVLLGVLDIVAGVERVMGHHLEGHRVPAGGPHVVDVLHPDARLADGEGVGRRRRRARCDQRLEVIDRGLGQEDVVAPAVRGDRIRVDALVAVVFEKREERLAHLFERELVVEPRVVDEAVLLAGRFAAGVALPVPRPEVRPTGVTLHSMESFRLEVLEPVLRFEITHWLVYCRLSLPKTVPNTRRVSPPSGPRPVAVSSRVPACWRPATRAARGPRDHASSLPDGCRDL
jgi:hypothetical protein